jgi:integral membrane sensor domain MASE1
MRLEGLRRSAAPGLRILAVAAAYYASAQLGLLQELIRGQVTPFWPPTGIALFCLLQLGIRTWPGVTLGAFLVNVTLGPSPSAVAAIVAGNTLAPVCAYLLLNRVKFRQGLDRLRDALALVFLGALGGMLISATVGSGVLVLYGALPASDFWPTWSVWWTGDAMGVLVITPLLLVLRKARRPGDVLPYRPYLWAEAVALLVGTLVVSLLATRSTIGMLFLAFPCLIWAAFRFQLAGAAPCVLIVSVVTIHAAADGAGPFAYYSLLSNMVTLQAFNGSAALTALLLQAVVAQRSNTLRSIEQVCLQLAEVVDRLAPGEAVPPWPLPPDGEQKSGGRENGDQS